jgi:hypothetical protein
MGRDPFGLQHTLVSLAISVLVIAWCLNWAACLIEEALPVLAGVAGVGVIGWVGWKVHSFRRNRW